MFRRAIGMVLVVFLGVSACTSAPSPTQTPPTAMLTPTPQPDSLWGDVSVLTESPTFHPPALTSTTDGFIAAAFTRLGTRWRLTLYRDDQPIETQIFADNPYGLTLHADSDGGIFAVWMDYSGGRGGLLYVTHLNTFGETDLGAIRVTEAQVARYSAAPTATGTLWLVWSAAPIPESVVMGSRVDTMGRPRTPALLINAADYPALVRADGRLWLFWLTAETHALHRAELTEAQTLDSPTRLNDGLKLQAGDILNSVNVGLDSNTAYLFWQLQREGQPQVWWTAGGLYDAVWNAPRRLIVTVDPSPSAPSAGYNHGVVSAISLGEDHAVSWAYPAVGQSETLPLAAVWDDGLGVLYWRDEELFAGQRILDAPRLIAAPVVAYDAARDLALGWWGVVSETTANLFMTYSRR